MTEIQGKSILVRVSEGSSYRESAVTPNSRDSEHKADWVIARRLNGRKEARRNFKELEGLLQDCKMPLKGSAFPFSMKSVPWERSFITVKCKLYTITGLFKVRRTNIFFSMMSSCYDKFSGASNQQH